MPASGKTTLSKKFSSIYHANLYSYDEIRKDMFFIKQSEIKMMNLVKEALLNNNNVIIDNVYITRESRMKLISELSDIQCEKVLVVVQAPIEVCIERDKNRKSHNLGETIIRNHYNRYQPPSLDEGWDDIIFIENF